MTLDLNISLAYMTSAQVKRVSEALRSDPSETRAGWYLRANRNEGYEDIVKLTYIEPEAAIGIARAIDDCVPGAPARLAKAVRAANIEHARNVKRSQEFLEKRIAEDTAALERMRAEQKPPSIDTVTKEPPPSPDGTPGFEARLYEIAKLAGISLASDRPNV